jgi:protoheme IX farnesyltransferase
MRQWANILLELTKIRISLFATLSASVSFILANPSISKEIILLSAGVFFLACGSCALNQYQERENDQLMERTRGRPIPSKRLNPKNALKIALSLIFSGVFILLFGTNWVAFGLGAFAVFWYHGIYTPLKKRTPFAVIPGALIGAIPPMIGWVSGGGQLHDPQILAISFLFYIWQAPHFWILLFNFGRDYEKGGFPSLERVFTQAQFKRVLFLWIFATGVTCFMIPLFGILQSPLMIGGLFGIGGWLLWKACRFLRGRPRESHVQSIFRAVNIYVLWVMVCFGLDSLFRMFRVFT